MHSSVSPSPLGFFERLRNKLVMFGVALELAHLRRTGRRIEVKLARGSNVVHHGLGRVPKGWMQTSLRAEGEAVPSPVASTGWDDETITFVASDDVTFAALVF